jgi:hypothetical protein
MKDIINGILAAPDGMAPGQVALANEITTGGPLSQPLTAFVKADTGAADLESLLDYICGRVPCGLRFEYRAAARGGKIAAAEDGADLREVGGSFRTVEARGQTEQGKCRSKGFTMAVDLTDDAETPTAREEAAVYLRNLLLVYELRRALALIDANTATDNKVWGDAVGSVWADPDADLMAALDAGGRNARANRALLGAQALAKRFKALRAGDPGKGATSLLTLEQLAGLLGLESCRADRAVYLDKDGAAHSVIPAAKVYGFFQPAGGTRYDASNLKRFTHGGWRVFERELESVVLVTVSHYSEIVCLDAEGLASLAIA